LSTTIHQSRYRQISQRKQSPTLTYISTIQVFGCHLHLCYGMLFIDFSKSTSCIGGKPIGTIQYFLNILFHSAKIRKIIESTIAAIGFLMIISE
jgi:hypothetical protein